MAAAAASGGAALGGLNPRPNPSGDGGPRLRSPPEKGNKPVALADITNTGRPNATRSISVADVVKENAKLLHLLSEKTKIIEVSRVEVHKLRLALQASRQQNLQLVQTNSQMLAELNTGKDRLKTLQHELSCTTALLKVKDSELKQKNKTANQWRKEVNSQEVMKAIPSKVSAVEARRIDGSVTHAVEHHLVGPQYAVPLNTGHLEPPRDTTKKRGRNKRKSESSECIKDTNIMQDNYKPYLQPIISLDHEDPRKPQRRRSSRLNPGSCDIIEVSDKILHADTVVPSDPSIFNIQKQHGPTTGKDMKTEINEQPRKEAMKEIQEACSRVPGVEAHQIGDKASNTRSHLAETHSSLPNTIEPPKPPEDTSIKRGSNKQKLELCESGKGSAIEDLNAICDTGTSEPLRYDEKRKFQRRKSTRLNSVSSDDTKSTFEALHEDVATPLPSSSWNTSMEQRINQNQTDACSSMKSTEGQVAGRRSLRRAAEKVVSYKEIPLNVKMRRP